MNDSLISEKDARKVYGEAVGVDVVGNIDTATVEAIPSGSARTGGFIVPAASPLTTLTFYGSHTGAIGSYVQIYDTSNAAISKTVAAARAYPLPPEALNFAWLKIVGNAAGSINLSLKT